PDGADGAARGQPGGPSAPAYGSTPAAVAAGPDRPGPTAVRPARARAAALDPDATDAERSASGRHDFWHGLWYGRWWRNPGPGHPVRDACELHERHSPGAGPDQAWQHLLPRNDAPRSVTRQSYLQ